MQLHGQAGKKGNQETTTCELADLEMENVTSMYGEFSELIKIIKDTMRLNYKTSFAHTGTVLV